MKRLVVTLTPWYFDPKRVELRVTVEYGAQTYEDRIIAEIPDMESAFDFYLRVAGDAIKAAWRADTEEQKKEETGNG